MAGSVSTKEKLLAVQDELQTVKDELAALKRRAAAEAPYLLETRYDEPITEYSDQLPARVLALAEQGLTEAEWIAEFGLSLTTWRDWMETYPELRDSVEQARARVLAWCAQMERRAIDRGYHSVPANVIAGIKRDALKTEGDEGLGDASELVRVTVHG